MRKYGYSSMTTLSGLDIIEGDNNKTSLSVDFSGKKVDITELRKVLLAQYPGAYMEKRNSGDLRVVIPVNDNDKDGKGADEISITDRVQKIVDITRCQLGCHFTLQAKPHGSKLVPEMAIRLDNDNDANSLLGRTVLEIVSRKIDPAKSADPLKDYRYEISQDGAAVMVHPNDEVCETPDEVMQYGVIMASHFKHHLGEAPHHLRLAGIDVPQDKQTDEEGKQTIRLVLSGDERELRIAKLALAHSEDLRTEITNTEEGGKKELSVYADSAGMEDIISTIRQVHLRTGFKLPVTIGVGIFPEDHKVKPDSDKTYRAYKPAVAVVFNAPETKYDPVLVHALSHYLASNTKTSNIQLRIPLVESPWGQGYMINLSSPTALVAHESYSDQNEAYLRAKQITHRLRNLVEYDEPEQDKANGK